MHLVLFYMVMTHLIQQRLWLGVTRGAVSPLAVINDTDSAVSLIIDDSLKNDALLGVHPCENTSTLFISYKELEKFAESCGHMLINMQV